VFEDRATGYAMSTTITIVNGISQRTSRVALKRCMSAFGEVDACHMGDRGFMGESFKELPIVRFKLQSSAEAALQALKGGQIYLDGMLLEGEVRSGTGNTNRQRPKPPPKPAIAPQTEQEMSSRSLMDAGDASFSGRDGRRGDDRRDAYNSSNRHHSAAAGGGGSRDARQQDHHHQGPRRRESPSRDQQRRRKQQSASRSRGRREGGHGHVRSRSRSAKKARGGGGGGAAVNSRTSASDDLLSYIAGFRAIKLPDASLVGNAPSSISDNPLFCGLRVLS